MRRSTTSRTATWAIIAVALVAVLAVMAGVAAGGAPTPSPSGDPTSPSASPSSPAVTPSASTSPSATPSPTPTATPTATPSEPAASPSASAKPTKRPASPKPTATASPTASPTATPSDEAGIPLDIATPHDVSVVIDDKTGSIVKAASGRAGDGMSVPWFEVAVENVDEDSLRVTWVGLPQDDVVRLTVSEQDGKLHLDFVQKSPPKNSDATGHDRVLIIDFDAAIDADDVLASVKESSTTQD